MGPKRPRPCNDLIDEDELYQKWADIVDRKINAADLDFGTYPKKSKSGLGAQDGLRKFALPIGLLLDLSPQGLPNFSNIQNVLSRIQKDFKIFKDGEGEALSTSKASRKIFSAADKAKTICRHIRQMAFSEKMRQKLMRNGEPWLKACINNNGYQ